MNQSRAIHVQLTKLTTLPEGVVEPFGARGKGPIEPGYVVWGYYVQAPVIGRSFTLSRYNSNGVEINGTFRTSQVTDVSTCDDGFVFTTLNSTYHLKHL